MPTTSDFAAIVELQQFKRLYEEQEEKTRIRLEEKEEQIAGLHVALRQRDEQMEEIKARLQELAQERERLRGDYNRLRQEAQEKIDKLMERIKELNQKIMGGGGGDTTTGERKTGIFR